MDSRGPLLIRQGIFHKANVPNNDILPRHLSGDTTLPALNSGRVKFLHVVLQKQKNKMSVIFISYAIGNRNTPLFAKKFSALFQKLMYEREVTCACYLSKKVHFS